MLKYIHKKKIYQNYNFFTTTSIPSNSIHNLNFAALTQDVNMNVRRSQDNLQRAFNEQEGIR